MFFMLKYGKACRKLGLSGGFIDSQDRKMMEEHGLQCCSFGRSPIDTAVSMYSIIMPSKIRDNPELYIPTALAGQGQLLEWVASNHLSESVANNAIKEINRVISQ